MTISESSYWKEELLRIARKMERHAHQKQWSDPAVASLEKEVFLGFFICRKLTETMKLTWATKSMKVLVTSFPPTGSTVKWTSTLRLHQLYDFDRESKEHRKLDFLANQFVHSYIFEPCLEEDEHGRVVGLSGVMFVSQRTRHKRLFFIDLPALIEVFSTVALDSGTPMAWRWSEREQDLVQVNDKVRNSG